MATKTTFIALLLVFVCVGLLFAGGTENKINTGAGYARFPAKSTECKKPDAVFHNPAGTAFMKDGLYVEAGNQFLYKEYSNKFGGETYKTDVPTYFYPDFNLVWKKGDTALFTGLSVEYGGGEVKYDKGNAMTIGALKNLNPALATLGHSLEAYSVIMTETVGLSHVVWEDHLSVAAAVRILWGDQNIKIKLDDTPAAALQPYLGTSKTLADTEADGFGMGGVLSVHFKPIKTVDIAATYHTEAIIDYEYKKAKGAGAALLGANKGDHYSYVLPAYLGGGIGWQIIPQLYVAAGFEYYFNKLADYDYDDAWGINFAAEYQITKMLAVSLGGFYTNIGSNSKDEGNNFTNPVLDSFTYCGGFGLTFFDDLTIDIGAFYVQYFGETWKNVKLNKKIFEGAISATYRFF